MVGRGVFSHFKGIGGGVHCGWCFGGGRDAHGKGKRDHFHVHNLHRVMALLRVYFFFSHQHLDF